MKFNLNSLKIAFKLPRPRIPDSELEKSRLFFRVSLPFCVIDFASPVSVSPTQLRKRVWVHQHFPYLPLYRTRSKFHGSMTFSRFVITTRPLLSLWIGRAYSNSATFQTCQWSSESPWLGFLIWSCFHASTVQEDSLLYLLGVSHNITESVKPFWNMKQK